MPGWRRVVELAMTSEEIERLTALSRSRTEPASRVSLAQMMLAYREIVRSVQWGKKLGFTIKRFSAAWSGRWAMGQLAAIEDRPRPGKEPVITPEAKAWLSRGVRQGQGARLSA